MALKTQGTFVRVTSATIAPDNITAITAAAPPVVTCGTHGIANGAIVVIQNAGGMVQLNNRAYVVANVSGTTLELKGIDATLYTPYTSGGTVTEQTMLQIGEVTDIQLFQGESAEIDTTHLQSVGVSRITGIPDPGNCSINCLVITDAGQARLQALYDSLGFAAFSVTRSDGLVAAFYGQVKSFPASFSINDVVKGTINLLLAGGRSWFA